MSVGGNEDVDDYLTPIKELTDTMKSRNYKELQMTYKVYPGKEHMTVWVPTLLDGLEKYLKK